LNVVSCIELPFTLESRQLCNERASDFVLSTARLLWLYRPGIYEHDIPRNRQVKWPQQFGGPMKPIQPHVDRKTLKTEVGNPRRACLSSCVVMLCATNNDDLVLKITAFIIKLCCLDGCDL